MPIARRVGLAALVAGAVGLVAQAQAQQDYPNRVIKLVVPYPPGGPTDAMGRLLALKLGQVLQQQVIVENKPGAGGNVGTNQVVKSAADGYTLVMGTNGPLAGNLALVNDMPYDPLKDLAPVTLVATSPNVLVVEPSLGAATLAEFVRVAKARPGQLNYGSVGNGSASHLAMELFLRRAGLSLVHVPYQGFPQIVNALLGGQIQASFMVPGIAMGQVRAGKLKALGVTTLGRVASMPDVPTFAEQGYPGFEAISWQAILAPAGTPTPIIERLSSELIRIIKSDEVRTRMLGQYFSAGGTTPEALARLMQTERAHWAKVIKAAGVEPQ